MGIKLIESITKQISERGGDVIVKLPNPKSYIELKNMGLEYVIIEPKENKRKKNL